MGDIGRLAEVWGQALKCRAFFEFDEWAARKVIFSPPHKPINSITTLSRVPGRQTARAVCRERKKKVVLKEENIGI